MKKHRNENSRGSIARKGVVPFGAKRRRHLSPAQLIIIGFAAVILVGSLLLMLPISTVDRCGASFIDALFTATSATCVTGLVVKDTATYWSVFGKAVIIVLIQIGGMGVVTVASVFALVSGKRIGLRQRSIMQEAISAPTVGGIVRLTRFIIKGMLIIELCGAVLLAPSMCTRFGIGKGILYSLFHSISAFCNAGFDLMGTESARFQSLTGFAADPLVNITLVLLILIGGIGFLTWEDVVTHKLNFRRYRMQSKAVLLISAVLIILPSIYFFVFEFGDKPFGERLMLSTFQAVTPRTAGFNTADLTSISDAGIVLMICLMMAGGSSGSTAGGMKLTTVTVLISCAFAVFRKRDSAALCGRRIADDTVRTAAAIFVMYTSLFLFGSCAISLIDGLPILTCMFEAASAVATVGLTLGITPELSAVSHIILILMMFLGRVGGLTMIFAAAPGKRNTMAKLPIGKITVG